MKLAHRFATLPLLSLLACPEEPSEPQPPSEPRPPHLVRSGDDWFITALSEDNAAGIEQGRLFAVMQPIPNTPDSRAIAVMRTLGPANGQTVGVGLQCLVPKFGIAENMAVEPLRSAADTKVGPCLARVLSVGKTPEGEDYVMLDVGSGVGVQPADQYVLLGQAVTAKGHTPLGLDTQGDGLCQITDDISLVDVGTSPCVIIDMPRDGMPHPNSFAAWMPRSW